MNLPDHQVARALRRFGLGELVSTAPVDGGAFGQNLFVTSTTGEYVLRAKPLTPWQFPTERYFFQLLHQHTDVPVPWPYLVDSRSDIFGFSYVLMPRLPGKPLSDGDPLGGTSPRNRVSVGRALGNTLARMHTVTLPRAGRYQPERDTIAAFPGGWRIWVTSRIHEKLRAAQQCNPAATTRQDFTWVEDLLRRCGDALDEPFTPTVVWEDFKPGNVLVELAGDSWRVTGVVDAMEAHAGDAEADLPRTVCAFADHDTEVAAAFLTEYVRRRPPRPGFADRLTVYLLLDRALLWFFFQHRAVRYWPEHWTFKDWAGRYLDLVAPLLDDSAVA